MPRYRLRTLVILLAVGAAGVGCASCFGEGR
jgi:hypothetical protein